jgi:hypothetical protein
MAAYTLPSDACHFIILPNFTAITGIVVECSYGLYDISSISLTRYLIHASHKGLARWIHNLGEHTLVSSSYS